MARYVVQWDALASRAPAPTPAATTANASKRGWRTCAASGLERGARRADQLRRLRPGLARRLRGGPAGDPRRAAAAGSSDRAGWSRGTSPTTRARERPRGGRDAGQRGRRGLCASLGCEVIAGELRRRARRAGVRARLRARADFAPRAGAVHPYAVGGGAQRRARCARSAPAFPRARPRPAVDHGGGALLLPPRARAGRSAPGRAMRAISCAG